MPSNSLVAVVEPERLHGFLQRAGPLPPLPAIAQSLIQIPPGPKFRMQTLVQILTGDPAITARGLRIVNSSCFPLYCHAQSLHHAASLLGLEAIKQVCIGVAALRVFTESDVGKNPPMLRVVKHSVATGLTARALGKRVGHPEQEILFTAGLLHDLGRLFLQQSAPRELEEVRHRTEEIHVPTLEAEQIIFKFDHRHVGDWVAGQWKLGRLVRLAILRHHDPDSYVWDSEWERKAVAVVAVADEAACFRDLSFCHGLPTIDLPATLRYLGLEGNEVAELTENLVMQVDEFVSHL